LYPGIYTYERFFPAEPLAGFVKFFYYFHGTGDQSERILPQSFAEITFNDPMLKNYICT
jgi:hypothetical protein